MFETNLNNMLVNEGISYFSGELFCILGMLLNFFLLFLPKRKAKIVKISNAVTFCALGLNLLCFGAILISNAVFFKGFDFTLLNGGLILNDAVFNIKSLFVLFFALFFLSRYKTNRKYHCYNVNLNLNILSMTFLSQLFVQTNIFFISYVIFEMLVFLAYKYSSTTNLKKEKMFAKNYVVISVFTSILFLSTYFLSLLVKNNTQLEIINAVLILTFLTKIGIFPIFNQILNSKHKNNLSFCVLSFLFLPVCGCFLFAKLLENINIQNYLFSLIIVLFLALAMISSAVFAHLEKSLPKFLIQATYTYCSFCLINQMLFAQNPNNVKMLFAYLYSLFAVYCLILVLKASFEDKKINLNLIKGLCYKDYKLANLMILALLFLAGIFPSLIFKCLYTSIREIYIFDKYVSLSIFAFLFSNCLILFGILKITVSCYSVKINNFILENGIKKGMTLNYIIPILILFVLFILSL